MAWFSNLNVSDFAGAVTKLSESVKNIEKNFDSALGFESSESTSTGRDGMLCWLGIRLGVMREFGSEWELDGVGGIGCWVLGFRSVCVWD